MNNQQENINTQQTQTTEKPKSGLATAGLIIGIIGVCLSFIPFVNNAAFVLGIIALIFGAISLVKKRCLGKAITSIVLGILSIVITLAMQAAMVNAVDEAIDELNEDLDYLAGGKTDEILDDYLSVKIGEFEVDYGEYYNETKLTVTLKNKGDERQSFDVTIEAVDKNGNRIDVDYVYVTDLGAGQSQSFDIFTFVSDDDLAAMEKATFRVVEASMY